ncbi:MAG: hypothetical protein A2046_06170 [Bacteroidetes bacterium GWA2_30_7]|nr:MAG: hypothetical protein A2046_06170 [Bacteroidetes bacterium GWA2_30_7]
MKTTNYFNTFIEIADDCPVTKAEIPPIKGDKKTVANLQYDLISANPYKYTSDEIIFQVHTDKNDIMDCELEIERNMFFSKGQPCFRSSPLAKRYGWGIHSNSEGKIAIFAFDSDEYSKLLKDSSLKILKAMRSKKE